MRHLFTPAEIAAFAKAQHIAREEGVSVEQVMQIEDFSYTLETVIRDRLAALDEPVFTNPTTGQAASSATAILIALDYVYTPHWSTLASHMRKNGGQSVFERTDLQKRSNWPTVCVDLNRVEELFSTLQVRKGPKVIAHFKEEHGL